MAEIAWNGILDFWTATNEAYWRFFFIAFYTCKTGFLELISETAH